MENYFGNLTTEYDFRFSTSTVNDCRWGWQSLDKNVEDCSDGFDISKGYGISAGIFELNNVFLSNREMNVDPNKHLPYPFELNVVVRLVSILAPHLIFILINDFPDGIICQRSIYSCL